MEYLKNNICNFKPLFPIDYTIKKNIVSCSFFKIETGAYKDFNVYIDGLEKLYKNILKNPYKLHLRLFIDLSIYNDKQLMSRIQSMDKIELVLYSCPNFIIESNENFHYGLFGTMIRFFPMFDFKNNDARCVIISDIDTIGSPIFFTSDMKYIEKYVDKLYFLRAGYINRIIYTNDNLYSNGVLSLFSMASFIVSYNRFDCQILYDFFADPENAYKTSHGDELSEKKYDKLKDYFTYGVDEYFLNKCLIPKLIKSNLPYVDKITWEIHGSLYYFLKRKSFPNNKIRDNLNYFLDYLLKKINYKIDSIYADDLQYKYDIIDKEIYKKNNNSYILSFLIYKEMIEKRFNPNYPFLCSNDLIDLIKKYNVFGYYEFRLIILNNVDFEPNYFLERGKKFTQNDINRLNEIYNKTIHINKKNNSRQILSDFNFDFDSKVNCKTNKKIISIDDKQFKIIKLNKSNSNLKMIDFFNKFSRKINKHNMNLFINIPISIKDCKTSTICIYSNIKLKSFLSSTINLQFKFILDIIIQACLITFYLNHILKIYHNDLGDNDNLNILINPNNNDISNIKFDIIPSVKYDIISKYNVVITNFNYWDSEPKYNTLNFYESSNFKKTKPKYISEVFIICVTLFNVYFKNISSNKNLINVENISNMYIMYIQLQSKSNNIKEFDLNIIDNLLNLGNFNL